MKKIILNIAIVLMANLSFAQQTPQYSMHFLDPLLLNPAFAGTTLSTELIIHHRNQWLGFEGAPMTSSISSHLALNSQNAVGGFIINDMYGPFRKTGLNLAYAHQIWIKKFYISMGISASAIQNSLNGSNFDVKNSLDNVAVEGMQLNKISPDVNFGILVYNNNFHIGVSVLQLLNFNVKYDNANMKYANHFYFNGGYNYKLNDNVSLVPSIMFEYVYGNPANIEFNVKSTINKNLIVGASYRNEKSAVFLLGYKFDDKYLFAYSYDLGFNSIGKNSIGSHEVLISLQLKKSIKTVPKF
jgi:type IX secretion system PorP/SprF family membrane protein